MQQLLADQELEPFLKWVHLNSFDRQWRPFVVGLLSSPELGHQYRWQDAFSELDLTSDPTSLFSEQACYAS